MNKINLYEKLQKIDAFWSPGAIGIVNDHLVKLAKLQGEFVWHQHEHEDEFFMVLEGAFYMHFRDAIVHLEEGDCIVVPKGVEHKPVAQEAVSILLFEPISTLNTGDAGGPLTKQEIPFI